VDDALGHLADRMGAINNLRQGVPFEPVPKLVLQ
jgi:hypothetical protein